MSENIVKHSADSIKERIINKIRADFVNLVSDEQWDGLVQTELDSFLRGTQYNTAPLKGMINEAIREIFQEKIKEELAQPEWQDKYGVSGTEASDMVKKLIKEHSAELMEGLMGGFMQQVVNHIRSNSNMNF